MTAPERIWADPAEIFDGMDIWRDSPEPRSTEYTRADLHDATKAQLAKAVEALREADQAIMELVPDAAFVGAGETVVGMIRAVLAEIEKGEPK